MRKNVEILLNSNLINFNWLISLYLGTRAKIMIRRSPYINWVAWACVRLTRMRICMQGNSTSIQILLFMLSLPKYLIYWAFIMLPTPLHLLHLDEHTLKALMCSYAITDIILIIVWVLWPSLTISYEENFERYSALIHLYKYVYAHAHMV